MIKRREFIAGLGSVAAWPVVARAQNERVRRIGVLMLGDENDPEQKRRLTAFMQAVGDLGWANGDLRMDVRWGGGDYNRIRAVAKELVGLRPEIILTGGLPATVAVQRETRTIPIVFVNVGDPVAGGIVARLDRPSENITGFAVHESSLGGKWLQLLSEIVPGLKQAAVMFNPDTSLDVSRFLASLETAAQSLSVALIVAPVHSEVEIETAIIALERESRRGLVVIPGGFLAAHRASIISAAARNNVPAIYSSSEFAKDGGLFSYGPDPVDTFGRAATYVDRILRGAKPAELPVQLPTKFETAVNLKTAKALGLTVPQSILLSADEVIE
jgi:putative ABC transport system substrate-binding protein